MILEQMVSINSHNLVIVKGFMILEGHKWLNIMVI